MATTQMPDTIEANALAAIVQNAKFVDEVVEHQAKNCAERFEPQRYLDENEREWYALDTMCRSRPWAVKRDQAFWYPFKKCAEEMMEAEGKWKGWVSERKDTRKEIVGEPIKQLIVPDEFPPKYRILAFTPEFGNDRSFESENWSYLEPENQADVWIVSWQGWDNFDDMLTQVQHKVLSFADAVSTTWFGQGAGALVAYELLKMLDKRNDRSPNLPVSLVVCDCPAPHLFAETYKPDSMEGWADALKSDKIVGAQKQIVDGDLNIIKKYTFKHGEDKDLPIAITALCHEGNPNAPQESVEKWESYCSKEDGFEFVDPLDEEEVDMEEYLRGKGYALNIDPAVVTTCTQHNEQFARNTFEEWADIGPLDNEIPVEVDDVVVGAGLNGLSIGCALSADGKHVIILDKHHTIGGIWSYYANDYSRVNTSEIGYRIRDPTGRWARANEDHTPAFYVKKDMHENAAKHLYGKCMCNIEVLKTENVEGGGYVVHCKNIITGKESSVKTAAVHFNTNRRIGAKRVVTYPGLENFKGKELYGYAKENVGLTFWAKNAIIVGAGAFAFENVRTTIEHGTKMCTMLCRREGTASPKFIDQVAFFRPMDEWFGTNKAANMLSFDAWRQCYTRAGIKTPACWDEGLLKPHNHTISVSDLVYIAGYQGMFQIIVSEIQEYTEDGSGVVLKNGQKLDTDFVIKCTGFHYAREVEAITGQAKMYPWSQLNHDMFFSGEPLLDGGQFGGSKGMTAIEEKIEVDEKLVNSGLEAAKAWGVTPNYVMPRMNPFGSGAGGPAEQVGKYIVWLRNNQTKQKALLEMAGPPTQNVTELWASQIGQHTYITTTKIVEKLGASTKGAAIAE